MSGIHGNEPIEARGFFHICGRDDDAHARMSMIVANIVDQLPELAARQGIDTGRRFIQDQQVGIMDQSTAQAELLLHAAGELPCRTIRKGREAGALEKLGDAALALTSVVAE